MWVYDMETLRFVTVNGAAVEQTLQDAASRGAISWVDRNRFPAGYRITGRYERTEKGLDVHVVVTGDGNAWEFHVVGPPDDVKETAERVVRMAIETVNNAR